MRPLVLALALVGCGKSEPAVDQTAKAIERLATEGPFVDVTADELAAAYASNAIAADARYKGKALRVTGTIGRIGAASDGMPNVVLSNDAGDAVICAWAGGKLAIEALRRGENTILRGVAGGQHGRAVALLHCDVDYDAVVERAKRKAEAARGSAGGSGK